MKQMFNKALVLYYKVLQREKMSYYSFNQNNVKSHTSLVA